MTVVTIIAAGDVRRVFAGRRDAVMTGAAGTQYLGVIHGSHRRPHIGVMAVFTNISRLYMCKILTGCCCAVMAADAVTRDIDVIENSWSPGNR